MAKPEVILLIDADFFCHHAAASCSSVVEWEDGILEQYADLNEGKRIFNGSMETIKNYRAAFADAHMVMCFTDPVNWRKEIWPDYKRGRSAKPLAHHTMVNWVKADFPSFQRPTLEGDDCLGILSTAPHLLKHVLPDVKDWNNVRVVIVSCDKDFNTIPGEFLWWDTNAGRHELKVISEAQADHWHMLQTLMGDATDGYPGCPGIGKDTALAFLAEPYVAFQEGRILKSGPRKGTEVFQWKTRPLAEGENLWTGIVSLFEKAGLTEEDALKQAQVARICRAEDFDLRTKEVIPWTPDKTF